MRAGRSGAWQSLFGIGGHEGAGPGLDGVQVASTCAGRVTEFPHSAPTGCQSTSRFHPILKFAAVKKDGATPAKSNEPVEGSGKSVPPCPSLVSAASTSVTLV